jgi:hypothetical protein
MALTLLKPTKDYVVKALKAYPQKLNMVEFINYTNFPIDQEIANSFYTQMKFGIPIYLGKYEIEFFGYKGKLGQSKGKIRKSLEDNFSELEGTAWWSYDNKKYEKYLGSLGETKKKAYPSLKTGRGQGTLEHILILPQLYENLLLRVVTNKASRIRLHYINMRSLVLAMVEYDAELEKRSLQEIIQIWANSEESRKHTLKIEQKMEEREIQEENREGFVYYIQEEDTERIKIGWAWDVERRLQTLQCGNSSDLLILKTIKTKKPWDLEFQLHERFSEFKIRGEWFSSDIID